MSSDSDLVLQVAAKAAITNEKGQVLIVREAATGGHNTKVGEWGLVGGRLEPGELFFDGLAREIKEETGLTVTTLAPLYIGEWRPRIDSVTYQIIAIFMRCETKGQKVQLSLEHDEYKWIDPATRATYPMMAPDCFVVDKLIE